MMNKIPSVNPTITGKTVLVTGAAGTIGSAVIEKLLPEAPKSIRMFDHNEEGIHKLYYDRFKGKQRYVRPFIGDMRDPARLRRALMDVDVVIHTAALKHVPLCEYNPFEAVSTNVVGTENLISSVLQTPTVKKALLISTDKAVYPIGVMGTTKLLAEKLFITANYIKGDHPAIFSVARFGNVWESSGSLATIWRAQIEKGEAITVTNAKATRFMFTIDQATSFLLNVLNTMQGGEIFVPRNLVKVNILDLAKRFSERIHIIGLRPGEKLEEQLYTTEEGFTIENQPDFSIIHPEKEWVQSSSLEA
jgi:UDP-N-acetylglucosamine 4,6-dehydratase